MTGMLLPLRLVVNTDEYRDAALEGRLDPIELFHSPLTGVLNCVKAQLGIVRGIDPDWVKVNQVEFKGSPTQDDMVLPCLRLTGCFSTEGHEGGSWEALFMWESR